MRSVVILFIATALILLNNRPVEASAFGDFLDRIKAEIDAVLNYVASEAPGLASLISSIPVEVGFDLVNFNPSSVSPAQKFYDDGSDFDLGRNDYAVAPRIPTHGPIQYQYLKHNGTGKIRRCVRVLGLPAKYLFQRSACPPIVPPDNPTDEFNKFCNNDLVNTRARYSSYASTVQCVNDALSNGLGDNTARFLTWDILVQGGKDLSCFNCEYYWCRGLYSPDNPAIPGLSSILVTRPEKLYHVGVPFMDTAWPRATDDYFSYNPQTNDPGFPWILKSYGIIPKTMLNAAVSCCSSFTQFATDTNPNAIVDSFTTTIVPRNQGFTLLEQCLREKELDEATTNQSPTVRIFNQVVRIPWRTLCTLDKANGYIVACLDPTKHVQLADALVATGPPRSKYNGLFDNAATGALNVWTEVLKPAVSYGHAIYQSPNHGIENFINLRQRLSPKLKIGNGIATENQPSASVSFFLLPTSSLFATAYSTLAEFRWDATSLFFGRASPGDAIVRDCPLSRFTNITNRYCNANDLENENACATGGLCLCDQNWLGNACDIPYPRKPDGTRFTVLEVLLDTGPSDKYEVCSKRGVPYRTAPITFYRKTGGLLLSEVVQNVPVCECMEGFSGTPEDWGFIPLYASMFHPLYVHNAVRLRGAPTNCYVNNTWATDLVSDRFRSENRVVNISREQGCTGVKGLIASFPYDRMLSLRQCLIYTDTLTRPSLTLRWDYPSFPFTRGAGREDFYKTTTALYPPPSSSERRRNAATNGHVNRFADGSQGVQCMDYLEQDWANIPDGAQTPAPGIGRVAALIRHIKQTDTRWGLIPNVTLFGGRLCRPCPNCNRTNSICLDHEPITDTSSTYCHCDDNFCGSTCDIPICPAFQGRVCGFGTCVQPNDPVYLRDGQVVGLGRCPAGVSYQCSESTLFGQNCLKPPASGQFAGRCTCQNGYEGASCSQPVCAIGLDDQVCSGSAKGTCNHSSRKCECQPGVGGNACERASCPRHPVTKEECSGAVIFGSQDSVCDTTAGGGLTPLCRCHLTTPSLTDSDTGFVDLGYPPEVGYTNSRVYLTGKWGVACERDFREQCMDGHGRWCGQKIDINGNTLELHPGYAGCFNRTCRGLGSSAAGLECKPTCQCTTEFVTLGNPYCTASVCGPQRCDNVNGSDTGDCVLRCNVRGSTVTAVKCAVPALLALDSSIELRASCRCKTFNSSYWFKTNTDDPNNVDPCNSPAAECYSGSTSPCNGHGSCVFNASSQAFACLCDTGFTGTNCSTPPVCLTPNGQTCTGSTQFCYKNGEGRAPVCSCLRNYLRDANRTCLQERCLSTGGSLNSDRTCRCPVGEFYEKEAYLPTDVDQTQTGCRKECPVYPVTGIPCGSLEFGVDSRGVNFRRSRCSDLLNGTAVFRDSVNPTPTCTCNFRGVDSNNRTNYFIDDPAVYGSCKPKCNPLGLCVGIDCKGRGTLTSTNECTCGPNWKGQFCDTPVCSGQKDPLRFDEQTCSCRLWCFSGSECNVDECAASGGACKADSPNDCDCSGNPLLTVNVSGSATTHRQCGGKCANGGLLNDEKTECVCPFPFTGSLCEINSGCPVQWGGVYCDINRCVNGGTPLPITESGCTCQDSYYKGELCQVDSCGADGRTTRYNASTCQCSTGYLGVGCSELVCGRGGGWNRRNQTCECFSGYTLAQNKSACLLNTALSVNCKNGKYSLQIDGSFKCVCNLGWTGLSCDQTACVAPQVPLYQYPDGTVVCGCPFSTRGAGCQQSLCNSHSTGSFFNPLNNQTECRCIQSYTTSNTADSNGVFQCQVNPTFCSFEGTSTSSVDSGFPVCSCKEGYTGEHCSLVAASVEDDTSGSSSNVLTPVRIVIIVVSSLFAVLLVGWYRWHRAHAHDSAVRYQPISGPE